MGEHSAERAMIMSFGWLASRLMFVHALRSRITVRWSDALWKRQAARLHFRLLPAIDHRHNAIVSEWFWRTCDWQWIWLHYIMRKAEERERDRESHDEQSIKQMSSVILISLCIVSFNVQTNRWRFAVLGTRACALFAYEPRGNNILVEYLWVNALWYSRITTQ